MFLMALGIKITIFVLLGLVLLYAVICIIVGIAFFNIMLRREKDSYNESTDPVEFKIVGAEASDLLPDVKKLKEQQYKTKELMKGRSYTYLEQTSARGYKLAGWYFKSSKPNNTECPKVVIFSHGWKSNGMADASCVGYFYLDSSYDILIVDHQGNGHSESKYLGFGVEDAKNMLKWVNEVDKMHNGKCEIYLHGVSMGANTLMLLNGMDLPASVKGIVADCGYTSGWDEMSYLVKVRHLGFLFTKQIIWALCKMVCHFDLRTSSLESLKHAKVPVLFIHGDKDNFVPPYHSKQNYDACSTKKELKWFSGCYHAGCFVNNQEEYEKTVLDFFASL